MRRFKLKVGNHTSRGENRSDGPIMYKPGDVIETDTDLVKVHGGDKFVELSPKVSGKTAVEVEVEEEVTVPAVVVEDEDEDDEEEAEEKEKPVKPQKPYRRR